MASMRSPAAVSTAALAASLWAAGAFAAEPAAIDVRLKGGFAPDLVATIARVGRPTTLEIAPGRSFREIVTERCGSVDPAYVQAFLRENPGLGAASLDALPIGTAYAFPACARTPAPVPRTVRAGETIERLFRERGMPIDSRALDTEQSTEAVEMSFACLEGPAEPEERRIHRSCTRRGFAASENAFRFMRANPEIDVRALTGGTSFVVIPDEPVWSTIALRDGVEASQVLAELAERFRPAAGSPADFARAGVANLVADRVLPDGVCVAPTADWPFAVEQARTCSRQQ